MKLLNYGIERVTPERWANYVRHALQMEREFFTIDNNADEMYDHLENFVFTVNTGETSSEDEYDEEGIKIDLFY